MKLKYRIRDIRDLQVHILQDYFSIEVKHHFNGDEWKDVLESYLKEKVDECPDKFKEPYNNFLKTGKASYQITDMDCTFLVAILNDFYGKFKKCRYKNMDKTLSNLQSDRNIDAHINSNESIDELFLWACGALYNISRIIDDILNNRNNYTDEEKTAFAQKNQEQIKKLQRNIVADYQEEIKFDIIWEDEVKHIQSSDRIQEYHNAYRRYFRDYDFDTCVRFTFYCADKGVAYACFEIANLLFSGEYSRPPYENHLEDDLKEKLKQNFKEAAKYYREGFISIKKDSEWWANFSDVEEYYRDEKIRYICLCKNNIIDTLKQEECDKYIKEHQTEIEEYKEGEYTFYRFKK